MIEDVTLVKAIDSQLFMLGYFDSEKKDQKGYLRTTKYGAEPLMRKLLESLGIPDAEVDQLFEAAKR